MILLCTDFFKGKKYLFRAPWLLFVIALAVSAGGGGCTPRQIFLSVKPFLTLGYGKEEAIKSSRFKMVDDFSSRDLKNRVGGAWNKEARPGSSIDLQYVEEEAVDPFGYALAVKYNLGKHGRAVVQTDLNGLDASRARALSLWFAYGAHYKAAIRIRITASRGISREVDLTRYLDSGSKRWQEVLIPVAKWLGVDFNQLEKLELIIESVGSEDGSFWLDRPSFFGPENVFFESLKDNLAGFPEDQAVDRDKLLALGDAELLGRVAKDTWRYFENAVDRRSHLPLDRIKISWRQEIGDYTSPTNIALYYLSVICARELGFITENEAVSRIRRSLKTVEKLPNWKGFLYNYYSTTNLKVATPFVSTVDNGWLAASLMVIKEAFPAELGNRAKRLLGRMDFYELYDAGEGRFNLGYDDRRKKFADSHYGLLITEARVASMVAIAKGDVEDGHWFLLKRVFPKEWTWQRQAPKGQWRTHRGITVFEGYYLYEGLPIVPAWGGSLFEFLMPTLVLKEHELARSSLGENNLRAARVHRDYALAKKHYPVWGISPCMVEVGPRSAYLELGVPEIGAKGYRDKAVIAPYASFLALEILPADVLDNIRRLLDLYPIYGEYGFYDSVALEKPLVTKQYLALDQGMILVAVTNYLKHGVIRNLFHRSDGVRKAEGLLTEEDFF